MPDLRQQRDTARTERDQLRRENANLRQVVGWIDPAYSAILVEIADLALQVVRRPDDLGGPISSNHAGARPPVGGSYTDNIAYDLLRKQRVIHRREAAYLRGRLIKLVDGKYADEAPTSVQTPLGKAPSQNGGSPTTRYGTISLSVQRAPQ